MQLAQDHVTKNWWDRYYPGLSKAKALDVMNSISGSWEIRGENCPSQPDSSPSSTVVIRTTVALGPMSHHTYKAVIILGPLI